MALPTIGWLMSLGINIVAAYIGLMALFFVITAPFKLVVNSLGYLTDKGGVWEYIASAIVALTIMAVIMLVLHFILP